MSVPSVFSQPFVLWPVSRYILEIETRVSHSSPLLLARFGGGKVSVVLKLAQILWSLKDGPCCVVFCVNKSIATFASHDAVGTRMEVCFRNPSYTQCLLRRRVVMSCKRNHTIARFRADFALNALRLFCRRYSILLDLHFCSSVLIAPEIYEQLTDSH